MATRKLLNLLLADIATKLNLAIDKETAIATNKDKYLYLEYASVYGGYRVINVGINNGAHYGALGGNGCETRLTAKKMEIKLNAILTTLDLVNSN